MKLKHLWFSSLLALYLPHPGALAERLNPSDLTYLGAFLVPQTDPYGGMGAIDSASSMSFRPDGDPSGGGDGYPGSLFLSNHDKVMEIKIPAPIKTSNVGSVNTAQQIQMSNGISVNSGGNDRFGAVAYVPAKGSQTSAKLYWSTYEYYNVSGRDYNCIGWSDVNLSAPNSKGLWHVGPAAPNWDSPYHGMKCGDYIIPIDQAWADQYTGGKSLLVGRYREAGAAGGSMGPVLIAIAPWKDGNPPPNGANLAATPLMSFNSISLHNNDTSWMNFKLANDKNYAYYTAKDRWHGGAWVARGTKKAIIMVGKHGTLGGTQAMCAPVGSEGCHGAVGSNTPPFCYGTSAECPNGIATGNDKGYQTGAYVSRFLFIDPDELAQVAQGTRSPSSVGAYATFDPSVDWPTRDSDRNMDVAGAAYDSANGLLYVAQANAYRPGGGSSTPWPLIHVYRVSGTGGTPPGLNAPVNLRIAN